MAVRTMESVLQCWGRGDEIEELLKPVLNREKRSAVLLYGDSGIGKSTVLREVRTRLTIPGVIVGFFETSQSDSDPLLRSLDDLLKQIYTVENSAKQILISCEKAKAALSVSGLKDFLLAAMKAMSDSKGLGVFAMGVTSFFGWAADKAMALDASVPIGLMPKLGVDVFTAILQVLRTALPEEQLVLLVDNISAPAEAVTSEIRGFGTLDTIQAFLSRGYAGMEGVHFVFSWKLSEQTKGAFRALSATFREYTGVVKALDPIQQREGLLKWLRHEFAWFRELGPLDQRSVMALTGGLPEIVVQWREAGMMAFDDAQLQQIAEDTRNGRFQALRDALESAPVIDMSVIYGLAMVNHPMPVNALSAMVESQPQVCLDVLRLWAERRVLRSRMYSGDPLPAYQFDHEHKMAIARDVLPGKFADGGEALQRRAYHFFLGHFSLVRLNGPSSQNPCSALYLLDAIELLSRSPFLTAEAQSRPALERAALMAILGEIPKDPPPTDWGFLKRWPYPFRGWFLDLCLATGYGSAESTLDEVAQWVSEPPPAGDSVGLAFAEGTACANLMGRMRGHIRPPLMGRLLDRLFALQQKYPGSPLMAREAAMALANAIAVLSVGGQASLVERLLGRLNEIAEMFAGDLEITRAHMIGLTNGLVFYKESLDAGKAEEFLRELRQLAEKFPGDARAAEALAKGLAVTVLGYKQSGNLGGQREALVELRKVREQFPTQSAVAYELGSALVNAISSEALETTEIEAMLGELRGLSAVLSKDARTTLLASGINNAVFTLVKTQQRERTKPLVEEIRALQAEQPDSFPLAELTAGCLGGAIAASIAAADLVEVSTQLEALRGLVRRFPQEPMPRHLAKGIANAVAVYAQAKQGGQMEALLAELLAMVEASPDNVAITVEAVRGLAAAIMGTNDAHDVEGFAAQLIQLHVRFPHERTVTEIFLQGVINAAAVLGSFEKRDAAGMFADITRSLSVASDGDAWILARHAEMLAVLIAGYTAAGDSTAVDQLLVEVKELRGKTSSFLVQFQCARALAKASMAYGNRREFVKLQSVLKWLRGLTEEWPESREMAGQLAWGVFNALMANMSEGNVAEERRLHREMMELEQQFPKLHMGDPDELRIRVG